ncbi:hypothetical protein [Sulfurimonas sp.]|uniref:hypothetical protein n=1 Tax=Sulfurimonas sp. TaxID=2022749 RepID=UPI0025D9E4A5|nr:hypothetical protein [Sulfurimonas sp.]MBW6488252.1 hypothetical protein [Sulfurimonas sp.]
MNILAQKCKELLLKHNINVLSEIDFDINGEINTLSFEYIIDAYMKASHESQLVFLTALERSIKAEDDGARKFFEGMGQLLLLIHLSKNIEV